MDLGLAEAGLKSGDLGCAFLTAENAEGWFEGIWGCDLGFGWASSFGKYGAAQVPTLGVWGHWFWVGLGRGDDVEAVPPAC